MSVSFSQTCFTWMMSSDYFNPSNCVLRPIAPAESIDVALNEAEIDLFACEKNRGYWQVYGKPVRALARMVGAVAIATLAAPTGALWHGTLGVGSAVYTLCLIVARRPQDIKDQWVAKTTAHVKAFAIDLSVASLNSMSLLTSVFIYKVFAVLVLDVTALVSTVFFNFCLCLVPLTAAFSNEGLVAIIASSADRAPLFKAIQLKNLFGIVSNDDGGLLPYSIALDQEDDNLNGYFGIQWKNKSLALLSTLREIRAFLNPIGQEHNLLTSYPPNVGKIIAYLKTKADWFNEGGLQTTISKLEQLEREIRAARELTEGCVHLRKDPNTLLNCMLKRPRTQLVAHYFEPEVAKNFLNSSMEEMIPYRFAHFRQGLVDLTASALTEYGLEENVATLMLDLRKHVFNPSLKPEDVFKKMSLKKIAVHVHPDKFKSEEGRLKFWAGSLFQFVTEAQRVEKEASK